MIIVDVGDNWECPFCGSHQAVTDSRVDLQTDKIESDERVLGETALIVNSVVCANNACKQLTLAVELRKATRKFVSGGASWEFRECIGEWRLRPESNAKQFPDYIPEPLRKAYLEAC